MPVLPPVLERELRVFSRGQKIFVFRTIIAVLTFLVALSAEESRTGGQSGQGGFYFMLGIGYVVAHFCGAFLTAPSLTDERQQGTLALLFITPLRPSEIILTKLVGQLMLPISFLLVMVPGAGILLLAGGISIQDVLLASVALVNLAVWSLAVGMVLAAFASEEGNPMVSCLLVLVLAAIGSGIAEALNRSPFATPGHQVLQSLLPGCGVPSSQQIQSIDDWVHFLVNQACTLFEAWWMVFFAGWRSIRRARTGAGGTRLRGGGIVRWIRYGGLRRATRMRRRLEQRPTEWLVRRNRLTELTAWALAAVTFGAMATTLWTEPQHQTSMTLAIGWLAFHAFKLLGANRGIDRARGERSSGGLELVLTTPLSPAEIRSGFHRGLARSIVPAYLTMVGTGSVVLWIRYWLDDGQWGSSAGRIGWWIVAGLFGAVEIAGVAIMGFAFGTIFRSRVRAFIATVAGGWLVPGLLFTLAVIVPERELSGPAPWGMIAVGAVWFAVSAFASLGIGTNRLTEALESLKRNPAALATPAAGPIIPEAPLPDWPGVTSTAAGPGSDTGSPR